MIASLTMRWMRSARLCGQAGVWVQVWSLCCCVGRRRATTTGIRGFRCPPPPFCWSGCAGVVQVPDLCYLRACRARGAWWRPDCRPWPCRTNECNKSSLMPGSRSAGHAHFGCQSRENGSRKTSQGSRIRRSRVGFGRSVNVVACGRSSWSFSRAKSQPQQQHHPASERVAYGRRLLLWCFSNICASSASIWTAGRRQIVPVLPFRTR
ncbi:hypothetical protein IWX50DRAFT_712614 [Phyllosticta citricarpa]